MRARHLLVPIVAAALFQLGANCGAKPGASITILSPGALVSTFSFSAQFKLNGSFDLGSVAAFLNDEVMVLSGGPTTFTATMPAAAGATVDPGFPLADDNVFKVTATRTSGTVVTKNLPFQYLPPKARAYVITNAADLITGPLADNRLGDVMMENSLARFAIQHPDVRDNEQIAQFGGNIIDAALVGKPGIEQFGEMQPSPNIETVFNSETIEILNDGMDGTPAIVRVCGPDDLLDGINASSEAGSVGGVFPASADDKDYNMDGCTSYTLAPLKKYMKVDTTVINFETTQIPLYPGDYINGMGEFETFTANSQVTSGRVGIGEILVNLGFDFFSYFGIGEGTGVDYAFLPATPTITPPRQSSSFTTSGVSFLLHHNQIALVLFGIQGSTFVIPAANPFLGFSVRSYSRHFGVGDGDGNSGVELLIDARGTQSGTISGCVTVAGTGGATPVPFATVVAGTPSPGPIDTVRSQWTADANGCYSGSLQPGTYGMVAGKRGFPYEGGGAVPTEHGVVIANGGAVVQDFALPNAGRLHVNVLEVFPDLSTTPVPARIAVVGFDPSPENALSSLVATFGLTSGLLSDPGKDSIPYGIVHSAYAGANGQVEFDLEPGSYQVFVSRGTEYSAFDAPITITAGNTTTVNASIVQVVESPGFVSSDFHVHQLESPDSRVSFTDRVQQYAGEGVENPVATDHQAHSDLKPRIAALGLTPWVTSTIGEEITTFDYGHFNAYPQTIDPSLPSGGGTDWGKDAPVGDDFPSKGHFSATPAEIDALAKDEPTLTDVAVQVNHIGGHFTPLKIDSAVTPPKSFATNADALALRLPGDPLNPGTLAQNFFHPFGALELWNGHSRSHLLNEFLVERIGIWMNLLNQGIKTTAIADTDSHEFRNLRSGGARAWTASSTDTPALIDGQEVARSVNEGRAVGGQGIYVQARLEQTNGAGVASFDLADPTELQITNNELDLVIDVQAPLWAPYDKIEVYANASTRVTGSNGGVPVEYASCPTDTFTLGGGGFTRNTVAVVPSVTGASRYETSLTLRVPDDLPSMATLTNDTWFVVIARATDGVSQPMYPVMPASLKTTGNTTLANLLDGNLGEDGVPALGHTNALYADVDGNAGFDAPGVSVVGSCP